MADREVITLYLAEWQKRMLMDFMPNAKAASTVKASIKDRKQWVMYRQPEVLTNKGAWNLYLTDEQIVKVSRALGIKTKISALLVTPEIIKSGAITFQ